MNTSCQSALLVFAIGSFACMPLLAQVPIPQPSIISKAENSDRRHKIHRELDANHDTVKDLYELLDTTPEQDIDARSYLEGQIQQVDARSNVLFEELDAIDRQEYQERRKGEIGFKIERLEAEAEQLRRSNHLLPATTKAAKAKALRKALADGSWKTLVDSEWTCDDKPESLAATIQLTVEVEKLKAETASLREEVQLLRQIIEGLTKPTTRLNSPH